MRLWPIVIFIMLTYSAKGQTTIGKEYSITQSFDSLSRFFEDSVELVIPLSKRLLEQEETQNDSTLIVEAWAYQGRAYRKMGSYVPAISSFRKVYDYAKIHQDTLLTAEAADQIGTMNTFMGNMLIGQKYLLEVAEIYAQVGSKKEIAGANNGLAIFYNDMGQKEKAIEMYNAALEIYEEIDDTMGRANIHANLGMLYIYEKEFQLAQKHILMQGKLDTLLNTQWGLGFHYDYMGVLYRKQKQYSKALRWYTKALHLRQKLPSHYNIAESRSGLSSTYLALNQYDEAIKQANEILRYKEEHQSLSQQMSAYSLLSKAYEKKGAYRKALAFHKEYKIMSDSIYQRDMLSEIADKDALYQGAKKDKEITKLDAENLISQSKIKNKNKIILFGGIALGIISILLFSLYHLLKKVSIQKNKLQILVKEKDILLREIHHRVKNNLQLVSSLLTMQGRSIDNESAAQAINEGKNRVRTMALIHQDLYNKENITQIGIKQYVEKLTRELYTTYSLEENKIKLHHKIDDIELDIDALVPLGLIINELITNSLKYAWPNNENGNLFIELYKLNNTITLIIKDDGVGFDPKSIKSESFGSTLISALTLQLDGKYIYRNINGSEVTITFKTKD